MVYGRLMLLPRSVPLMQPAPVCSSRFGLQVPLSANDWAISRRYWEIRNSWGTYWGELGFMKIQRGVNALQLEAGDCW